MLQKIQTSLKFPSAYVACTPIHLCLGRQGGASEVYDIAALNPVCLCISHGIASQLLQTWFVLLQMVLSI